MVMTVAIGVDNGVKSKKAAKHRLFAADGGLEFFKGRDVSAASRVCLALTLQILWKVQEARERLAAEILLAREPLKSQVELLVSIKGVTPLIAQGVARAHRRGRRACAPRPPAGSAHR